MEHHAHPHAAARFSLHGKVAWVIGGAGYLGSAICHALAEHGAAVVATDLRPEPLEKLRQSMTAAGHSVDVVPLDVSDEQAVVSTTADIASRHGHLDIVVNAAWYYVGKAMDDLSLADWNKCMNVTLSGAFLIAREVGKVMKAQGSGSIIQFSSMYGMISPDPGIYPPPMTVNPPDYGAAKAGVLQLVRYQGVQLAKSGVRVNAIVPGPFPFPDGPGKNPEFVSRLQSKVPMGRFGVAKEIVGAVIFLASDASSYVTGTQIVVDGGWTAW